MVMQDIKSTTEKNGPALQAILMAMRIRRYDAKRIAQYQYGRSRASLDATGRSHQASICPVSPLWTPWSSILAYQIELWRCGNHFPKLAFKRHETDPLLS
jgi:hypothetical protein